MVKKLLVLALIGLGAFAVWRKIQADNAELDLWTEATTSGRPAVTGRPRPPRPGSRGPFCDPMAGMPLAACRLPAVFRTSQPSALRGYSSAGRASGLQPEGQGFESP